MRVLVLVWVGTVVLWVAAVAAEDDVRCLRGVKAALDGDGHLSWNFSNGTVGFVCSFLGISCWNPQENRVLGLNFQGMSLAGSIPADLRYCAAATVLDLSSNGISGEIPAELCSWLPYLVTLDLSNNQLAGAIPPDLSGCRFLNTLLLSGNRLDGAIPSSLAQLDRLTRLDLSGNRLSGPIPAPLGQKFDSSAFDENDGLCGRPVSSRCGRSLTQSSLIIIIAAGVFGAVASLALAYLIWRCWSPAGKWAAPGQGVEDGRWWAERLRSAHNRLVPVSLFQKPLVKVKLADLMAATSDFHPPNIIVAGSPRMGTSYKAVLPDGSALTVKRLHSCPLPEKQFRAEMGRIGQLRHPNLVPLLGFCIVEDERLLVYKHMPNGALSTVLESSDDALDWPTRVRIAIGAARGLAWLHHGFQIPFLHQNLSLKAILLDEDYDARIIDFGFTKLMRASSGNGNDTSPFLNGDFGEFGYIAPEFATNSDPTTKIDVYAFGIILLELLTGQRATEISSDTAGEGFKGSLVDWVNRLTVTGRTQETIDTSLQGKGKDDEIMQVLRIASGCVVACPKARPSMYSVYQKLKKIGDTYDHSEHVDEFPLVYGKDELENP
ncbi:probable inactive receptor kinase At1g27190 [Zingiber officinale]|nr:probable inactive receptor kinase At1g27190 [Zingiber officinale]